MRTLGVLGVFLLVGLVAMLLYCQCGDRAHMTTRGILPYPQKTTPLRCNDEAVLERLVPQIRKRFEGIFDIPSDYTVVWERKSADHMICRAKAIYKAPLADEKPTKDTSVALIDAVNEVFGLKRKPGDTMWIEYRLYRTQPDKKKASHLFVELLSSVKP